LSLIFSQLFSLLLFSSQTLWNPLLPLLSTSSLNQQKKNKTITCRRSPPRRRCVGERRRRHMQWFRRSSEAEPAAASSSDEAIAASSSDEAVAPRQPLRLTSHSLRLTPSPLSDWARHRRPPRPLRRC
ncbi:hypothetical protein LINPERPRIM_LOCUS31272, partial [Linum perenne]